MVAINPGIGAADGLPWARSRGSRRRYSGRMRQRPRGDDRPRLTCVVPALISVLRHPTSARWIFMSVAFPPITSHFAALAGDYDVVLSDVWGVVHNGIAATAEACDALTRFRAGGGTVVLITNAPRPGANGRAILDR